MVANSDSEQDQNIKLRVRDAIVDSLSQGMADIADVQAAKKYLRENLSKIESVANTALEAAGVDSRAVVTLCKETFDTRKYDTFTLPAGLTKMVMKKCIYDVLRGFDDSKLFSIDDEAPIGTAITDESDEKWQEFVDAIVPYEMLYALSMGMEVKIGNMFIVRPKLAVRRHRDDDGNEYRKPYHVGDLIPSNEVQFAERLLVIGQGDALQSCVFDAQHQQARHL